MVRNPEQAQLVEGCPVPDSEGRVLRRGLEEILLKHHASRLPSPDPQWQHPWVAACFHIYILRCADGTYYVGHTDDLQKRLAAHQSGRGSRHTAARLPVELVYSETAPSRTQAMARETQLKKWSRAKKEALISADTSTLRHLSRSRETEREP